MITDVEAASYRRWERYTLPPRPPKDVMHPDGATGAALAPAEAAVAALRDAYLNRYGAVVFDVAVRTRPDGTAVLQGEALLPGQRDEALRVAQAAVATPVVDEVTVLTEQEGGPWFDLSADVVAILDSPDGELATEILSRDPPLRRLADRGPWWLVEAADGTLGWCLPEALRPSVTPPERADEWRADYRGEYRDPPDGWAAAVAPWIGTPYRWGGTSPRGIDCSGLIQRVMKESAGLGLPKHSTDQIRLGRRVSTHTLVAGDVVYLVADSGQRHVAMVVRPPPDPVVAHAGRERGVVLEPLAAVLERYRLKAAARFSPE